MADDIERAKMKRKVFITARSIEPGAWSRKSAVCHKVQATRSEGISHSEAKRQATDGGRLTRMISCRLTTAGNKCRRMRESAWD
jgi:hypothetical protein